MHAASAANPEQRLFEAAEEGDPEDVVDALEAGADVNALDERHWSALMIAAHHNDLAVVETLIQHGANLNLPTAKAGGFW
ncbi:ankyrin repeat domain-containing protein [Halorhodospira halochloris]|uniref:ankyrin repeat domain-containing protein n=1 Tax=Halorhodospira halochloris TaxID=1052 RepID=UPI001EE7CD4C|nr:ankyrin repeat domain-containing protein [Halorhodospira halochloris]MCG5549605.1 ankyrin repeat domain-containing protein [Halorhodospira halochloris]